jgi:hypothetical protein
MGLRDLRKGWLAPLRRGTVSLPLPDDAIVINGAVELMRAPHSGQRSEVARRSYPHEGQSPRA